nr:uncharacterized protein LOC112273192 [Physcomitrium patens]|eukprot:XP_024357439.1 uncharacterized protein LOC112273192 [Physcomitrella patens]
MVDSSPYPMIRESAAAAIAKLVASHPGNRAQVIRGGGVQAMVTMARWATTLPQDAASASEPNGRANIQAAALAAVLNLGNLQERHSNQLGLHAGLPLSLRMLESDDPRDAAASAAALHTLRASLASAADCMRAAARPWLHAAPGSVSSHMLSALLCLARSTSRCCRAAAIDALIGLKHPVGGASMGSSRVDTEEAALRDCDSAETARLDGVYILSTMLGSCPSFARENVTSAFAYAMASDKLSVCVVDEELIIQKLMMILEEGPTIATRVSAAASIATIGARKKRLNALSKENILLLVKILVSNESKINQWEMHLFDDPNKTNNSRDNFSLPHVLLREHIIAIVVYIALSGDYRKQLLIDVGMAPILVGVLRKCLFESHTQGSWQYMQLTSDNNRRMCGVPPYLHVTQEFATMGLIMLADKSIETTEKIVESGGVFLLVKMLSATTGCQEKLGANWSEMAAAALLTMAGSQNAREEIVRVGGVSSLVQVLKGEGGACGFSFTGLAAMAQLIGVLGLNNEETKARMAEEGAVKCLVEILTGGSKCYLQPSTVTNNEHNLEYVALTQEAAAAALATVVLHCQPNAEAAVQAGAIEPLVKLLGPPIASCDHPTFNSETHALLPSTYKAMRSKISLAGNKLAAANGAAKLASELGDSTMNTSEDNFATRASIGGPLAAMAALGNMVSCYPPCWREIVDTGAAPRLANLLSGGSSELNTGLSQAEADSHETCATKTQESAALVLDLLIDCEEIHRSA